MSASEPHTTTTTSTASNGCPRRFAPMPSRTPAHPASVYAPKPGRGRSRRRRRRYSSLAFFLTILFLSALALVSHLSHSTTGTVTSSNHEPVSPASPIYRRYVPDRSSHALHPRASAPSQDEECRLVHQAKDQCAYIAKHCPEEDAGFYTYLSLYFCNSPRLHVLMAALLVLWLALLFATIGIAASDFFCINLSTISTILGMSESLAGVTFLAFGNGSPDVFSTFAAFSTNSSSLAIGELFGAACFITAAVAGSMAVVRPFKVAKRAFVRDVLFFAFAACFSLGFLWDGRLQMWECVLMVLFYLFYVAFVVVWHWYMTRRKRLRERLALARTHYLNPNQDDVEHPEYHDDEEDHSRPPLSRGASSDNFSFLERQGSFPVEDDPDADDDDMRDHWLGELNSNMHLNRPRAGSRRNTLVPIRPSLVGALEFRALMQSLQQSRSSQTIPMNTRRFSEDAAPPHDAISTLSDPPQPSAAHSPTQGDYFAHPHTANTAPGRSRAASANDASTLGLDDRFFKYKTLQRSPLVDIPEDERGQSESSSPAVGTPPAQRAPDLVVSGPDTSMLINPWRQPDQVSQSDHLAPPADGVSPSSSNATSPQMSPRTTPLHHRLPKLEIPRDGKSSPCSPFPAYHEPSLTATSSRPPSIYLPSPSVALHSRSLSQCDSSHPLKSLLKWWPYSIFVPPEVLFYTLFPTLEHWSMKTWWERMLAVAAAPSVLLLTITLPVVDSEREEEVDATQDVGLQATAPYAPYTDEPVQPHKSALGADGPGDSREIEDVNTTTEDHRGQPGTGTAAVAVHEEQASSGIPVVQRGRAPTLVHETPTSPMSTESPGPKPWNRWLTITQLFLAPLFMVFVIYTQYLDFPETVFGFAKPLMVSTLVSLILLLVLLMTTTPTHRPRPYHAILSLIGFVVSVGWISTIASQVVAGLKALAVIWNMSHAVMGLTIFAVGNSLGDLVADITVAKLGFPVMALSACFGGPMLNILLGIGISGSYVLLRGAEHRHKKHPGEEYRFRSYDIEVGKTLMISGCTLVATLFILLIAVPCNNWILGKRLGWALIALWAISTLANVIVVESFGVGTA